MASIDIMIVGSQKSGTSSLLAYLGAHPGVFPQRARELTWFTDPVLAAQPFPDSFYFGDEDRPGRRRLGKLAGLMYDQAAGTRLAEVNPSVTAVAILRDPVSRAYASYWFARRRGRESLGRFEDAIAEGIRRIDGEINWERSGSPYLDWSCYAPHLERLQARLGPGNLHVLVLEDVVRSPRTALTPLVQAVGLDADLLPPSFPRGNSAGVARSPMLARARRRGGRLRVAKRLLSPRLREALRGHYRRLNELEVSLPAIDPDTEARLRALFEGPNRRLENLLGRSVDAWRPRR
jgi:hypothetical protein